MLHEEAVPALFHKLNVPSTSVAMSKLMYPPLETESSVNGRGKNIEKERAHNLLTVKWAHAINCQQLLDEALNGDYDMIEADIVLGKVFNNSPVMPIMAHPPLTSSDLSLDSFLLQIKLFNLNNPIKMKGVKLDFKSIDVFEGALDTLKLVIPEMTYPVWLNADIIEHTGKGIRAKPVNPKRFLAGCMQFKKAVLSIGWTTSEGPIEDSYTPDDITAMLTVIKENKIDESGLSITFPVRAGLAANSQKVLHDLIRQVEVTNRCTITIWSAPSDCVDTEKLDELILFFGPNRVYLDVPAALENQLNLPGLRTNVCNSLGVGPCTSLLYFSLASIGVILISLLVKKSRI
uniref:Menorin-like domain-containing protein n=1 Tax=Glossina austeni TaxID=7395 RepID=A0A1A9V6V1_GLOAU